MKVFFLLFCLPAAMLFSLSSYGQDMECMFCHEDSTLTGIRNGREVSMYVNAEIFASSIHGAFSCTFCHSDLQGQEIPHEDDLDLVSCGTCHSDVEEMYQQSTHGMLFTAADPDAPACKDCHGTHDILPKADSNSPTFPTRIPELCARCHRQGEQAAVRRTGGEQRVFENYTQSIHGKGLFQSGLVVTATCTSCHTAHRELPSDNPESSTNRNNITDTCSRCHYGIEEQFNRSIHSPMVSQTDLELPVCSDCHSAHTIQRVDQEGFILTIMDQCGRCHQDITRTYFDTYHGKVSQLGYTKTAKCYDCHGTHDILPTANPQSHLSQDNILATCQKCHPSATEGFTGYLTHATHDDPNKYPWLFWTFWGMTGLIIGTFAVSGAHTLLWLPRALKMRSETGRLHSTEAKEYQRFSHLNRILHIGMIVTFISLAFTGMTIKFSYTTWASLLSRLLGGFESAGYIHRSAATLMIVIFLIHLYDLLRIKRKSSGSIGSMIFGSHTMIWTRKDLSDIVGSLKWFLGMGPRPRYGRWTYWEKFDYFAVFWGIAVIGSTGLILWFSEFFTRFLPGQVLNVATIIHSDEALLAAGFIFTIHFFNTHLRPEKFPMDICIFTGRMPLEELKQDKPLEYDELVQTGELDKRLVEPYTPIVIKTIRVFAWAMLCLGFAMIAWIVYAMLFA